MVSSSYSDKLTLVVPTRNRPDHLKRLLAYYTNEGCTFSIVIADGSSQAIKEQNAEMISQCGYKKVQHLKVAESTEIQGKCFDSLQFIKTPYVVLLADDDFAFPKAIKTGVSFLDKDPDYVFAQGFVYEFMLQKQQKKDTFRWVPHGCTRVPHLDSDDIESRLMRMVGRYWHVFYGLYRTEVFADIFTELTRHDYDPRFAESLLAALLAIRGKIKHLYCPFAFREIASNSWGRQKELNTNRFYTGMLPKALAAKKSLVQFLSAHSALKNQEIEALADNAIDSIIDRRDAFAKIQNEKVATDSFVHTNSEKHNKVKLSTLIKKSLEKFELLNPLVSLISKIRTKQHAKRSLRNAVKNYEKEYAAMIEKEGADYFADYQRLKKHVINSKVFVDFKKTDRLYRF